MKKSWFQMRLTPDLKESLSKLADQKGVSMTYLVESILKQEINSQKCENARVGA